VCAGAYSEALQVFATATQSQHLTCIFHAIFATFILKGTGFILLASERYTVLQRIVWLSRNAEAVPRYYVYGGVARFDGVSHKGNKVNSLLVASLLVHHAFPEKRGDEFVKIESSFVVFLGTEWLSLKALFNILLPCLQRPHKVRGLAYLHEF
jgi:hypothetical protein